MEVLNILDKDNPQGSKILDLLQKVLLTRNPVQGSGSGTIGHYPEKVIHLNQSQPSQGSQTISGYFTNTASETTCKGSLVSKASHPAYQGVNSSRSAIDENPLVPLAGPEFVPNILNPISLN